MRAPLVPCFALAAVALLALAAAPAQAEPTEITIRVLGKDSKFIGTSMAGARIVLRDAQTGEILAQGITQGSTGDTTRIMDRQGARATLSDESAAKFTATLDLDRPRLIEAEAYGPLAQRQAANRATSTQWVVPGRHISGRDGWVLELPGFAVDVLAPPAHKRLPADTREVDVRANVVLMCGCPIEPGGLWDADQYEVKALVTRNGETLESVDLSFAGETSQFAGAVLIDGAGVYDVVVYAYDAKNGNTGLDRTAFIVVPE